MSLFQNVNVVSVYVTDWEGAKEFYRETLDWPVAYGDDQVGWEEYGRDNETHIAINRWDGPEAPPAKGGTTPVFTVQDAYQVTKALRAKGIRCDDVVAIPNVVTYGTFYDPEGNRFQFASSPS
jgi:predicted enzyme related to lactoylglutathione lyase